MLLHKDAAIPETAVPITILSILSSADLVFKKVYIAISLFLMAHQLLYEYYQNVRAARIRAGLVLHKRMKMLLSSKRRTMFSQHVFLI